MVNVKDPPPVEIDRESLSAALDHVASGLGDRGLEVRAWLTQARAVLDQIRVTGIPGDGSRLELPGQQPWPSAIGMESLEEWGIRTLKTPLLENQSIPGMVVVGGFPPEVFSMVWRCTPATDTGYQPAVYVLETQGVRLLLGLAVLSVGGEDIDEIVRSPRYRPVVDADPFGTFERMLTQNPTAKLPQSVLSAAEESEHKNGVAIADELLARLGERQRSRFVALTRKNRLAGDWSHRKARIKSREGLRILLPTTRYATVVRDFADDAASALRSLGHECLIVEEPGSHELMTTLTVAEAVEAFDPDLVFSVNYPRGVIASPVPENLPIITWVQDQLLQHDAADPEQIGRCDVVVGHLHPSIQRAFGEDRERMLACDVAVSAEKFAGGVRREEYACEIAMMTRHSESIGAMADRMVNSFTRAEGIDDVVRSLASDLPLVAHTVGEPRFTDRVGDLTRKIMRDRFGSDPAPQALEHISRWVSEPMADLLVRQETARWAASICERRGWRFCLYGRGWANHPELSEFAGGELAHGSELRNAYASAFVVLHASSRSMMHQRVAEAAISGSLPLARRTGLDIRGIELRLIKKIVAQAKGEPWLPNPLAECYKIDDVPAAAKMYDSLLKNGLKPNPKRFIDGRRIRVRVDFAESLRQTRNLLDVERYRVFGDLASSTFGDEAGLESLVERAVQDPAWRASKVSGMAAVCQDRLTIDHWLARAIDSVRTAVARS